MIFNGRDLLAFCGAGVSINKEIPPASVGRAITSIGGANGHILGHAEDAPRTYTAKVNLHGATMADAWALKLKLAEWAYTTTLADLIPTHDQARKYRAIVQSIGNPEFKWGACTIDVVFYIPDARMIEVYSTTATGTDSVSFLKTGTADPLMTVSFTPTADLTDPVITLNGNAIFAVNGNVLTGVPCVVDFDKKTLMKNGVVSQSEINYMQTVWHPDFAYTNTIEIDDADISVEVTQRWL